MVYFVIAHKATRGSHFLEASLPTLSDAIAAAVRWYEHSIPYYKAGLLQPGVAVLVMTGEDAADQVGKGIVYIDKSKVLYQAGSY